ncbi:MAG: dihydroorotase [Myxococcota bacterium]
MTHSRFLLERARVIDPAANLDQVCDVLIEPGRIEVAPFSVPAEVTRLDCRGLWALPGLIDLQVHFREPGFEHKETIATGAQAAFAGGVTTVVVMPNTKPTLDTPEAVRFQRERGDDAGLHLLVAAAASCGIAGTTLSDHGALKAAGAVAVTDDGFPLLDDGLMLRSLELCRAHDLLFMQHAEDTRMSRHAPMNEGEVSRALGVMGQPADAEGVVVERDLKLALEIGARYHVLHTSTARSLQAIRAAKQQSSTISCEASPHHLLLSDEACRGGDPNTKMNPPLRSEADRRALVQALCDGTVDAVATDHAPHHRDEKAKGFVDAPFGVTGLETAFAAVLSFVHDGLIDETRAVSLMTKGPAHVLRNPGLGTLAAGALRADLCLVDPARAWVVDEGSLRSRSRNSCFLGRAFRGRVVATFAQGRAVYDLDGRCAAPGGS